MIKIRPMKPDDADELSAMLAETWHENFDATLGHGVVAAIVTRTYAPENLNSQARDPELISLVASAKDRITGHAMGKAEDDCVFIHRLYVHPGAQRSGLGDRLYNKLLARLPARKEIRLEVIRDNPKARAFYEKRGFTVTGKMNECLGAANVPSLKMTKKL